MEECGLEVLQIKANHQVMITESFKVICKCKNTLLGFITLPMHSNSDVFQEIGPAQTTYYMKAQPPLIPTIETISFWD